MKRFVWEESAKDDVRHLDQRVALEILRTLTRFAKGEEVGKLKRLTGDLHDYYRLRFGDWRVVFQYEDQGEVIHVYAVRNRKDVYRG